MSNVYLLQFIANQADIGLLYLQYNANVKYLMCDSIQNWHFKVNELQLN